MAVVDPPPPKALKTLSAIFEQKVTGDVRGVALLEKGPRASPFLLVNVGGVLYAFDAQGAVGPVASSWKAGDAVVAVGDDAFDPASHVAHSPPLPKTLKCSSKTFSADASRMSAHCDDTSGDTVYVYDTRTGAQIGVFKEFQTAAPIRSGSITQSGNFVFWVARSEGRFEEIKSHVTGPSMSSHSVMSPDERLLFSTVDRNYFTDERSPASMLDPKHGTVVFSLPADVDTVFFSSSEHGRMFAAHHSRNWGDMSHATFPDHTWLTIHLGDAQAIAQIVGNPTEATFAHDESAVAVRFDGVIRVYSVR